MTIRRERKARRGRSCDLCNGQIAPGERYVYGEKEAGNEKH